MRELPAEDEACPHCGYDRRAAIFNRNHLTPGSELCGRYVIGRALGLGSFGNTYIGWDARENVRVTIKEFLPSTLAFHRAGDQQVQFNSPEGRATFEKGLQTFAQETAVLRRLTDAESVSRILDYVSENGTGYAVMEYLSGETLKARLARCRTMDYAQAMQVLVPVLRTLDLVHRSGLLHRDISPDNIFLCDDGRVKLLDFGSAQFDLLQESEGLSVVLKHGYAPLEQYVPHMLCGPWTDVFGTAATLYKMLTGIVPPDVMQRRREDTLVKPSELECVLPEKAENALLRALSLQPEDRYPTAQAFLDALTQNEDEAHESKRTPVWIWILLAAVVIGAGVLAAVLLTRGGKSPEPPESTTTTVSATTEAPAPQNELQIIYFDAFAPDSMEPVLTAGGAPVALPYAVFGKDGRKGLVSEDGRVVLEPKYTSVVWDTAQRKFLLDGATYWDEQSGKTQPTEFVSVPGAPDLSASTYQYSDMLYRVTKSGERIAQPAAEGSFLVGGAPYGIVTRGTLLVEQVYEKATPLSCGVSALCRDGKWTYYNAYGIDLFGRSFDGSLFPGGTPYSFSEGYVPVYDAESKLWGYADTAGNTVIEPQFILALPPHHGTAWIQNDAGFGSLQLSGDARKISGKCGENVTYSAQAETGLLVIEGYGAMWDYTEENVPWLSFSSRIRSVRFDGSVSYIGSNAFANCGALSSVTLSADLRDIGPFAFYGCGMLQMPGLPAGLVTIGDWAFARCDEVTDVVLPESLQSLGYGAFQSDAALRTVSSSGSIALPDYAFYGCPALTTVNLSGVTNVGNSAFEGCAALTQATLSGKASSIGKNAFKGCTALETFRVPTGVTVIEPSTFEGCTALRTVTLPDGLRTIGQDAFSGCTALSGVSLPPTLTQIGARAFYNCRGLQNALVPDSVTRIDDYAFAGCTGITSFDLKDTVKTLGSHVFNGWTARQTIWLKNPLLKRWLGPPSGWSSDWNAGCYASITSA